MRINLNWLKDYIQFNHSAEDLADQLTMIGLEVEDILSNGPNFNDVVVGKVIEIENHPSADKLKICKVDIGDSLFTIVCAAPNVAEGQIVPVAKVGAVLQGDFRIEGKTIRGVYSQGMICSERELGMGDNHDGILVLNQQDYTIGENFHTVAMGMDPVLNINVTPNRPDCLSYIGIAREISVILREAFSIPDCLIHESQEIVDDWISLDILDSEACPRYSARVIRDVEIAPSPDWLKKRLESIGVRSINNVVDITNYVLMETGHPLHGFDYNLISGGKIIVRKAGRGEAFITLDGEKRSLTSEDLLICDGEKPVALAGVMGGVNSEITDHTRHILLESAYFAPMTIRKTAKRLGLNTEASQRFERGTDPNNTVYAIDRAAKLISDIAGGKITKGVADNYPSPIRSWEISIQKSAIAKVLGSEIPDADVIRILKGLDLTVEGDDPLRVIIPTFRSDLKKEIDLIEEIVRHFGYDNIPVRLSSKITLDVEVDHKQRFIERLRDLLVGMGFLETMNNSMVSKDHVSLITPDIQAVYVQNPINPDTPCLRTNILGGVLDSVRWNKNRSEGNLKLFEIGRIFKSKGNQSLPDETESIGGVLTGSVRQKPFWDEPDISVNFFHLKGILEALVEGLHIPGIDLRQGTHDALKPEIATEIICRDQVIGMMGEVHGNVLERWGITNEVYVFEIDLEVLFAQTPQFRKFESIPKFPAIKRDLAVIMDKATPTRAVQEAILKEGGKNLVSVDIFDLYQGPQIPSDKKSVAFSLKFLSNDRTLKEDEVDPVITSIMKTLEASYSTSLRS